LSRKKGKVEEEDYEEDKEERVLPLGTGER